MKIKLYRARTELYRLGTGEMVSVAWNVERRTEPVRPYAELIPDYPNLELIQRMRSEAYVDEEFFTEAEVAELRTYLKATHGTDIEAEEEPLPVADAHIIAYSRGMQPQPIGGDATKGMVSLAEDPDCGLSVPVVGYYDVSPRVTH
ncbi:MAG: hypothetical protein COZ06_36260 [Armatimonadetes bacterium CG_4_10_14_3_um_filter_66_18]|nr:hypothetical protein [Armatimonadota bacterium]OIP01533.1 MAG: hypothetical protein AUJ96_17330 [Armatimonadetes bacterium CG2_30_66_41]PIU93798.1 MAG: hypothetical protein COS65_10910 [Armatimonadetes bacterium CG06_land_8_20_14_3_00_66_21]PIX42665.1 MAG: hypothetical protein COZ57_20860 [Armatimonadetes bacterium CG_4_8_14_3_um_filter_66_20]PIY36417.1 MAG: hypothetical protein COZ06_36260 [Armatimonadetes bacterium CG_4_10_14_3_um_filter_66_18]PIZ29807.1 MAG: hypothetical protein COY42_34